VIKGLRKGGYFRYNGLNSLQWTGRIGIMVAEPYPFDTCGEAVFLDQRPYKVSVMLTSCDPISEEEVAVYLLDYLGTVK
jgi:hypothetical protein